MFGVPQWIWVAVLLAAVLLFWGMPKEQGLKPAVMEVAKLAEHAQEPLEGLYVAPFARVKSGEVSWFRLDKADIPMHYHGQNEIVYVIQGQGILKAVDGSTNDFQAGQLIVLPAGTAHAVNGSGEGLGFYTPPENARDTVFLEGSMAKPGAKADPNKKPEILNVAQRMARGLDQEREGFRFTVVFESKTGSVELFRIEKSVKMHHHPKENHILYILKGKAKGQIGKVTAEAGAGQVVVIPAGVPHKFEALGGEPVEFILFSTPPFKADDIVWDEK